MPEQASQPERRLSEPVSFLMPVCNEVDVIRDVLEEWHEEVFRHLPAGTELILDDGASTDGTLSVLDELAGRWGCVRIIRSVRDGFAASARRLYQAARCPLMFFTDSDGQYVPAEFWRVADLIDGADMVHGAKVNRQDPLFRRFASWGFNQISRRQFGVRLSDINSAFRLMRRELVDEVLPQVRHMPTLLNAELLLRAAAQGYVIRQVSVAHRPRKFGTSRGLPVRRFARDCYRAYRGLASLKQELQAPAKPEAVRSESPT